MTVGQKEGDTQRELQKTGCAADAAATYYHLRSIDLRLPTQEDALLSCKLGGMLRSSWWRSSSYLRARKLLQAIIAPVVLLQNPADAIVVSCD